MTQEYLEIWQSIRDVTNYFNALRSKYAHQDAETEYLSLLAIQNNVMLQILMMQLENQAALFSKLEELGKK